LLGRRTRTRPRFHLELESLEARNLLSTAQFHPAHLVLHAGGAGPADMPDPWPTAFEPADIRHLYGIDQIAGDGTGMTIAIVDAYDDPKLVSRSPTLPISSDNSFLTSDLHHFDLQYNLPEPSGFFTKVNQTGGTTYPGVDPVGAGAQNGNWEAEEALDVEWAHAVAPGAKIILVEANDDQDMTSTPNLFEAVAWAGGQSGAQVVSMSWGDNEFGGELGIDSNYFPQPGGYGVTYVAASGDSGAPGTYPAYSPLVVAVGGTTLNTDANGNYQSEDGWTDTGSVTGFSTGSSGGGISLYEPQPTYQSFLTQYAPHRAMPDVAFDADTFTGVSVYDSYNGPLTGGNWFQIGGTSLGSPCWSGLFAIADQLRAAKGLASLNGASQTLPLLYRLPAVDFHDITTGNNGQYSAGPGYDLVTGLGSPVADKLVPDLANQANPQVVGSTPAIGASVTTTPTSFTITFSDPINPATVSPSALQVNGSPASTATLDPTGTTITFTYTSGPVSAQGPQSITVAAGAVDAQGSTTFGNAAFSGTFYYDTEALAIVSTSPGPGSTFSLPASSFTYQITFNEPIDPGLVSATNLTLSEGTVTAASVLPGNQTVSYTLSGLTAEGALTINVPAGTFKDQFDNPASSAFSAAYYLDNGTIPLPPLTGVAPLGSLGYSTTASSLILYAGDQDHFTVTADPGETLTVVVKPSSSSLTPVVQLSDPGATTLGSAAAGGPGQNALLQAVPTTTGGTYTITIGGKGVTTGGYTVLVYFNTILESASLGIGTDNARATAQNLDGSFVSLQTSVASASQAAVLGAVAQPIALRASAGGLWDSTGSHNAASSSYEVGQVPPLQERNFFVFDLSGQTLPIVSASLNLTDVPGGYHSSLASDTYGLFDVSTPVAALAASGTGQTGIFNDLGSGVSYGSQTITMANDGTVISTPLNAAGIAAFNSSRGGLFAVGGALTSISGSSTQVLFGSSGNPTDTMQLLITPADARYYSLTLQAGELDTVGLKYLTGSGDSLSIQDSTGRTLATGTAGAGNLDQLIGNFTPPAAGTYYLVVSGSSAATYNLVVTRDATFDSKTNSTSATAQDITGTAGVSGSLSSASADWYKVTLASSQSTLQVQTSTPLAGPNQPVNTLTPSIQLYNASSTLAASGTLLPDGRNQSLVATGLTPGATYYIQISAATGQGEYFLGMLSPTAGPTFSKFLVTAQVAPSSVSAGSSFLVTIQAADQFGNPITSGYSGPASVTLNANPASASSSFPETVSIGSNGLGTALGTLDIVGTYAIMASGGAFSGTSAPLTVTPGPAVKLAFAAQPVNTPTGDVLPAVTVQILDQFGNVVTTDNSDSISLGVAAGPGTFRSGSTMTATANNGVATFSNLTLVTPGTYQLSATVPGAYTGPNSTAFSVVPLQVVPGSLAGAAWGFSLQFNAPILSNSTTPVLYGKGFGALAPPPSVIVTTDPGNLSDTAAMVEGSVVLGPGNTLTFVATNTALQGNNGSPLLPDGTYTLILRSTAATDGFQALNAGGGFLDGLASGVAGSGDYKATFTVSAAAMHDDVVWIPDAADGPGQPLEAPGMNQAGGGYPIYLNDTTGNVSSVLVTLNYDPTLLNVTGVTGAHFTVLGTSTPGHAVLQYSGPALPTGNLTPIGFVTATVPSGTTASPMPYKAKDLLHLSGVSLNGGSIPVTTSDALHLVAYVGDANGDGVYSSDDAAKITRAALQIDSGFTAYPLADPVIVADTDGAGFIPADAALQVNEAGVNFPTANLPNPPLPSGTVFTPLVSRAAPHTLGFQAVPALSVATLQQQFTTSATRKHVKPQPFINVSWMDAFFALSYRRRRSGLDSFALIVDNRY
jgi:hypothetical protein